jgi:hypothetical protein
VQINLSNSPAPHLVQNQWLQCKLFFRSHEGPLKHKVWDFHSFYFLLNKSSTTAKTCSCYSSPRSEFGQPQEIWYDMRCWCTRHQDQNLAGRRRDRTIRCTGVKWSGRAMMGSGKAVSSDGCKRVKSEACGRYGVVTSL